MSRSVIPTRGGCPSELGRRVPRLRGKPFPQRLPSKPGFTFQIFTFLGLP